MFENTKFPRLTFTLDPGCVLDSVRHLCSLLGCVIIHWSWSRLFSLAFRNFPLPLADLWRRCTAASVPGCDGGHWRAPGGWRPRSPETLSWSSWWSHYHGQLTRRGLGWGSCHVLMEPNTRRVSGPPAPAWGWAQGSDRLRSCRWWILASS